jgi:hypothetical protein
MAAETFTTFDGNLKRRYVGKTESLVPSYAICQNFMKFDSANKTGERYQIHVRVARPHGVTIAGTGVRGTAYALNGARAGQTRPAFVEPSSFILQEQVSYDLVAEAADSGQSFTPAMDGIVKSSVESSRFYQEMMLLYGGSNIGQLASGSGAGTTRAYVITVASWAVGLWSQMEGAAIDFVDAANDGGAVLNTNEPVIVTSVDCDTRTINVSGNATDLTAISAAIGTGAYIKPVGFDGGWGLGIARVLSHTSGTLFGINSSNHGLWKASQYANGSAKATLATFINAGAKVVGKGGMCDLDFLVSHWTFADLGIDTIDFKRTAEKDGFEFKAGARSIELVGPQGRITITQHPMVMAGHALGVCRKT